jgi:hypothetical protein
VEALERFHPGPPMEMGRTMTTTSIDDDTTASAPVIALATRRRDRELLRRFSPEAVERRLEELLPRVEAGDGAAMVEAINQAIAWWHASDDYLHAMERRGVHSPNFEAAQHIMDATNNVMQAVGTSRVKCLRALAAKAMLLAHFVAYEGSSLSRWSEELSASLLDDLQDRFPASASFGARGHE